MYIYVYIYIFIYIYIHQYVCISVVGQTYIKTFTLTKVSNTFNMFRPQVRWAYMCICIGIYICLCRKRV